MEILGRAQATGQHRENIQNPEVHIWFSCQLRIYTDPRRDEGILTLSVENL